MSPVSIHLSHFGTLFTFSLAICLTVTYFCKLESWEFCVHSFNTQSRRKGCVDVSQASWSQDTLPPSLDDEPVGSASQAWGGFYFKT